MEPSFNPQETRELADSWLRLFDPATTSLSAGAMDLLQSAPTSVKEAVAAKLAGSDALDRVVREGNSDVRSRILNSAAMNTARLRDYAPSLSALELDQALSSANTSLIASFAATAQGFRHLPPSLVTKVISALDKGILEDQARRELFSMLQSHDPSDLKSAEPMLRRWLTNASADAVAAERRSFARTALLAIGAGLTEQDVKAALNSTDPAQHDAAIKYLQGPQGTPEVMDHLVKFVNMRLVEEQDRLPQWIAIHDLLASKAPIMLGDLYKKTYGPNLAKVWSNPAVAAEWVKRAPEAAISLVATTSLDLYDLPNKAAKCDTVVFRLALSSVMARARKPTLTAFWQSVISKEHECRDQLGETVDDYLTKAAEVEDVKARLTELFNRFGAQQLADWKLRSAQLSQALSEELERRLLAGDAAAAKQLIVAGVAPSAARLESKGFWSATALPKKPQELELYFRAAQAAGSAPSFLIDQAAKVATDDALDAEARAYALMAIASTGQLKARQDVFNTALLDTNPLVARTAMLLLNRAYDDGMSKTEFKRPIMEGLGDVLTRPELNSIAGLWLARLARFDPQLADKQAEKAKWVDNPSSSCFAMATARPLSTIVGLHILNNAPDTTAGDELRACVAILYSSNHPLSVLARNWSAQAVVHPEDVLGAMITLRKDPEFASADRPVRVKLASLVSLASPQLPYGIESQQTLAWWGENLRSDSPGTAAQVDDERRKRVIVATALAIPGILFVHLGLWLILLLAYPKSPSVQAVVFWNPIVRKLLGLGYVDLVLLYLPFARRRLFAPFRSEFLRDAIDPQDPIPTEGSFYYGESCVRHRPARVGVVEKGEVAILPITSALARPKGRVLLLGKSGLGKSSFLKHCLRQRESDVIVYLRADQCRSSVEAEITNRMKGIGSDVSLLKSAIYAGRLWVCIDGYNEVDLATQDAITAFVGDYPHGNILIASQILLRGFTGIETFELMPLERDQIQVFLTSRASTLPEGAIVKGDAFRRVANAFLEDTWGKSASAEETSAFEEILANPMDLTSVALLLSQGGVPDVFALEKQQFDAVVKTLRSQGAEFRTLAFSKAIFKQRLDDQEDLGQLQFKPEVTELIRAKLAQVRTFSDPAGAVKGQEVRFRHDRIRDFFTHFALLEAAADEQVAYAKDARLAGVFPYLARSMPTSDAETLRENLITLAANIEDHRVSDSFIREFSWRQKFASKDPDWMLAYDLPKAKSAEARYEELVQADRKAQQQMLILRDEISRARGVTRILTASDPSELVDLAAAMLIEMGASPSLQDARNGRRLITPDHKEFLVVPLAQPESIRQFHVDLLAARIPAEERRVLVIANWQTALAPDDRRLELESLAMEVLNRIDAKPFSSSELYEAYRSFLDTGERSIWRRISWLESTSEGVLGMEPA